MTARSDDSLAPSLPAGGLRLRPNLRRRAWGGSRLAAMRPSALHEPGHGPFGESWELADLPSAPSGGVSQIDGEEASLHELLARHCEAILGRSRRGSDGRFPLLLKYLDAATPLSVQCHPSPEYAASHPSAAVKHEGWFVLEATPGAVVYRGFRRPLSRSEIEVAVDQDRLHEELVAEPVGAGDFIWLPSGTCHALGGGLLVAEIQTPSDTTYRVHDWGRDDPDRPLHKAQSKTAVEGTSAADLPAIVHTRSMPPLETDGFRTWPLHRGEWFDIDLIEASSGSDLPVVTNGVAVAWMVLEGEWRPRGLLEPVGAPSEGILTVLWPACTKDQSVEFIQPTRLLRIQLAESNPDLMPDATLGASRC